MLPVAARSAFFFDYDPTNNTYGSWDIAASNGNEPFKAAFSGFEYDNADSTLGMYSDSSFLSIFTGSDIPAPERLPLLNSRQWSPPGILSM